MPAASFAIRRAKSLRNDENNSNSRDRWKSSLNKQKTHFSSSLDEDKILKALSTNYSKSSRDNSNSRNNSRNNSLTKTKSLSNSTERNLLNVQLSSGCSDLKMRAAIARKGTAKKTAGTNKDTDYNNNRRTSRSQSISKRRPSQRNFEKTVDENSQNRTSTSLNYSQNTDNGNNNSTDLCYDKRDKSKSTNINKNTINNGNRDSTTSRCAASNNNFNKIPSMYNSEYSDHYMTSAKKTAELYSSCCVASCCLNPTSCY